MNIRDFSPPYWSIALLYLIWSLLIIRLSSGHRRFLDMGWTLRVASRMVIVAYFVVLWTLPGLFPIDLMHFMSRSSHFLVASTEVFWMFGDWLDREGWDTLYGLLSRMRAFVRLRLRHG